MNLLQDLASVSLNDASFSLNDASVIAKDIAKSYYGQAASYTYHSGCSQGGRQGMMLAQRYPDAFDGIAASAPAINWAESFLSYWYPSVLMDELEEYPPSCEIDAITAAAVEACDGLDGVVDNVITYPDQCDFDPSSVVGQVINCTNFGEERPISAAAATLVQAAVSIPPPFFFNSPYQDHLLSMASVIDRTVPLLLGSTAYSFTVGWSEMGGQLEHVVRNQPG